MDGGVFEEKTVGLAITAYRKLTPAPNAVLDSSGYTVEWETYWRPSMREYEETEKYFPGRAQGIIADVTYAFADKFKFRAGSYGGYNAWRRQLGEMVGIKDSLTFAEGKPFAELVYFSDCDGFIGPTVSAKLLKDFQENLTKAEAFDGPYFLESYRNWMKAFEFAADGGAVSFH